MKERIIYSPSYVKDKNLYNFLNLFSLDFKPKMKERDFLFFIQSVWEFLKMNNDVSFCIESSIHCVKKKFHGDIENIISMLNKGHLLSYALEKVGIFPEYSINILKAGENNKNFKETFLMLKNSTMVYPTVLNLALAVFGSSYVIAAMLANTNNCAFSTLIP